MERVVVGAGISSGWDKFGDGVLGLDLRRPGETSERHEAWYLFPRGAWLYEHDAAATALGVSIGNAVTCNLQLAMRV
jgi:hypothetical protein